jgi:hypothetical protein
VTVVIPYVAKRRLEYFAEMLAATGWTAKTFDDEVCWLPPEHYRAQCGMEYGQGHLHIWDALNAQARLDCAVMTGALRDDVIEAA